MLFALPIFLAEADGGGLDVVVWLVAGAIWLFSQIAAAKQRQKRKTGRAQDPAAPAAPPAAGGGEAPTPAELADIFRRLGADIPATPPPAPRPRPAVAPRTAPRPGATRPPKHTPERIQPELARRLAQAKQAAAEAALLAASESAAPSAGVPGVQSRAGESRALDTATRHTGMILPRIYAMGLRLAPWPMLPTSGNDRSHHAGQSFRPRLRSRRDVRDALIAQTFLQPPKGLAR